MALHRSSTAATALLRRCLSPALARRRVPPPVLPNDLYTVARVRPGNILLRPFSATPSPPPTAPPPSSDAVDPPASLAPEAGLGAQAAMRLFVEHGAGKRKLEGIAAERDSSPFVERWQRMIATYLETQCHVIALLGYRPDERGIALYSQQLTEALKLAPPDVQEELRKAGRDTYRAVLAAAFDVPSLLEEQEAKGELSIVDARNMMHKVSLRMQDPEVLEKVAKQCSVSVAMNDSPEAKQIELARKHTVVQNVMVEDVYMNENGDGVSLVQELGFGQGEEGYVRLQGALAEHQGDPLITQYVGAAMMKLFQSAAIDMEALQKGQAA